MSVSGKPVTHRTSVHAMRSCDLAANAGCTQVLVACVDGSHQIGYHHVLHFDQMLG